MPALLTRLMGKGSLSNNLHQGILTAKNKLVCSLLLPYNAGITSVKLFTQRGADSMESMWVLNSFLMGVDRWLVHFAPRGMIFLFAAHTARVKLPPTPQKWQRPEKLRSLLLSLIDPPSERPNKSRGHSSVVEMKCLFGIDYLAAAPVSICKS